MMLDTDAVIVTRSGEPLYYDGEQDHVYPLGKYLAFVIDALPALSIGETRKLGDLSDRIADARGLLELTDEETALLLSRLEQATRLSNWVQRNLRYRLGDTSEAAVETWLERYRQRLNGSAKEGRNDATDTSLA